MSATRFAGMSLPQLEMQAKIMEANERAAAAQAEQQQIQQRINAMPPGPARDQMVQFYNVYGTLPPAGAGASMMEPQTPTGRPMLTPFQRLQQVEQEYMAINAVKTDSGRMTAGLLSPPTAAEVTRSQQPAVTKWGDGISDMDPTEHAALVAKVAKWGEYQQARAAVMGDGASPMSAGGQAPGLGGAMGMPSVQPADNSEAALLAEFRRQTGRDVNWSDDGDKAIMERIEAATRPR
jgi:hypothetical protein